MHLTENQKMILENSNLSLAILLEAEELNSDDETDASVSEEQDQGPVDEEGNPIPPEPSEEEIYNFEMEGTEDKFLQFVLYDKLVEFAGKIDILKDTIQNDSKIDNLEILQSLEHYAQYLKVLNELIFSISTSVIYKLLGQIELELIDLLGDYNLLLEEKMKEDENEK